ncbi:Hypothetical protein CINCED_3A005051 [Cinara cedri]|uniref:Uncharacterized protein n=1 Tax=Cinara cedri TaxID=506608 RepID=A0A5E4N9C0_9HEMI|nr:Hypothetical protein CINCED_3A005051 [Cinara cedri]
MDENNSFGVNGELLNEVIRVIGNIGKLSEYKIHGECSLYEEHTEQYFKANSGFVNGN